MDDWKAIVTSWSTKEVLQIYDLNSWYRGKMFQNDIITAWRKYWDKDLKKKVQTDLKWAAMAELRRTSSSTIIYW